MGRFLRKQICDWSICSWWWRGKEEEEGCQVNGIHLIDFFLYFSNPHTNTDANTVYTNARKGCSTIIPDGDCHHSSESIIEQKIDYMKLRCSLLLSTRLFYLFVLISQA